jgi:hypothetical protein
MAVAFLNRGNAHGSSTLMVSQGSSNQLIGKQSGFELTGGGKRV